MLCVKDNHPKLHEAIQNFVNDDILRGYMDTMSISEKNRDRRETRTACTLPFIDWLDGRHDWNSIKCVCALHREFITQEGKSSEWHYYISSRELNAKELLHHARMEWTVETMHWLLDVIFREDECRVENKNVQQNLNMARKIAINLIKNYRGNFNDKRPISNIMLNCLVDCNNIFDIIAQPNKYLI